MRLIDHLGQQLGIKPVAEALELAVGADLDLVEVAPQAAPPVCKIIDFSKYRYEQQKREHEARTKQKRVQVKEVKFSVTIGAGDYQRMLGRIKEFIAQGDRVKVTLRFKGREITHRELGFALFQRIQADLAGQARIDQSPRLEAKILVMMLA